MAGIWIVLECEVISEEKIQFLGVILAVKLFQGLTIGFGADRAPDEQTRCQG